MPESTSIETDKTFRTLANTAGEHHASPRRQPRRKKKIIPQSINKDPGPFTRDGCRIRLVGCVKKKTEKEVGIWSERAKVVKGSQKGKERGGREREGKRRG